MLLGSKLDKRHRILILIIITVIPLLIRTFGAITTPIDSDEVMWGVMAERTMEKGEHYLYFTDQNFRGSVESYVIVPFQKILGVTEITLRINTIIFGLISTCLIFYLTWIITKKIFPSIINSLFYNLTLPEVFVVQSKAWGNYVLVQALMLTCFILFFETYNKKHKINIFLLIGLISGLSFWANEQSLYFLLPLMFFSLFFDMSNMIKQYNNKKLRLLSLNFLSVLTFMIHICGIFYLIARKRMIYNPILSLVEKFGFKNLIFLSGNFNIRLEKMISIASIVYLGILIFSHFKNKRPLIKTNTFLRITIPALLIISIDIINNSFSRVSATGMSIADGVSFLEKNILIGFFGNKWPLFLILVIIGTLLRLYEIIKSREYNFKLEDILILSFYLFPMLLVLSALPKMTPTPRYLIIWWPICTTMITYSLYKISQIIVTKYQYVPYAIFVLIWSYLIFINISVYKDKWVQKKSQGHKYMSYISNIKNENKKICEGNYWDVGLVMFYSNLDIKCFTSKEYGVYYKFLDMYKTEEVENVYLVK